MGCGQRLQLSGFAMLMPVFLAAAPAHAQAAYPERPITLVISYAAGGPSDVIARLLAQSMGPTLGQPMVIENVAGAGGTAGAARAARAAPDGHTLLIHHVALAIGPALYSKLPYETLTAFEPIGLINSNPFVLLSKKALPVATPKELLDYIRTHKDKVSIGHAGIGSGAHLCNMLLQSLLGVRMSEVPYRGTGPALNDVVAGQIDLLFDQTIGAVPQIQAGTVKPFAVTSAERIEQLKNVPTMQEAGLAAFEVTQWHAFYAPAGTPQPVLAKIGAALEKALKDAQIVAKFAELGTTTFPEDKRGPAETKAKLRSEVEKWSRVIASAGVKAE